MRRLREAASIERKIIQHREVQDALALEVGLDVDQFRESIESGSALKAFYSDRLECQRKVIHGFPSYIVKGNNEEVLLNGYIAYQTFNFYLQDLSNNRLLEKEMKASVTQVLNFITRQQRVALIEVATVFNISIQKTNEILVKLTTQGLVEEKVLGNGKMYSLLKSITLCDSQSGACFFNSEVKK